MADLKIVHTHLEGTLIEGSRRGDGVYEVLRPLGWKWMPSIGSIGLRMSRDRIAKRWKIEAAERALTAAGHTVTVEIDDTHRPRADVVADQAARLDDRAEALHAKAARRQGEADAARNRSHDLVRGIPPGQPMLVDHHSYAADRNRREKSINLAIKAAVELQPRADEVARRAAVVGVNAALAETPSAAAERIPRLEAELRDIHRKLDGYTRRFLNGRGEVAYVERHEGATPGSDWDQSLRARAAQVRDQLDHDRMTVARGIEAGTYTAWGRDNVHVGDLVSNRSTGDDWREVVKVNKVTVEIQTGRMRFKMRFTEIRRLSCPHERPDPAEAETSTTVPDPEPAPEVVHVGSLFAPGGVPECYVKGLDTPVRPWVVTCPVCLAWLDAPGGREWAQRWVQTFARYAAEDGRPAPEPPAEPEPQPEPEPAPARRVPLPVVAF